MDFALLVDIFNRMAETSSRLELTSLLADLFSRGSSDLEILSYFTLGKLAPEFENKEMYVADKMIIKALSEISGRSTEEIGRMQSKYGDLGSVTESILGEKQQRSLFAENLTVRGVYETLMKLPEFSGSGSTQRRIKTIEKLLISASPVEAKYIVRIISGKLRLGVSEATVLSALIQAFGMEEHRQIVENAYNFYPDMGYIAALLRSGDLEKISGIRAKPLIPFKVMLAERLQSIEAILDKMGGKASFEYKYDGLRVQLHRSGKRVKIFSRGSEDLTDQFPDIVDNMLRSFDCSSCILDGEAVPVNPETGEMYPFQMISQRRGRKYGMERAISEIPITVFLFDIIHYNGEFLGDKPYPLRRSYLKRILGSANGFSLADALVSDSVEEIQAFFNKSIADGCEGLVAKSLSDDSTYRAGARGWLWIKIKKDYQAELADTLDLVVVGAFHGRGRRKGTYGALLMAVFNDELNRFETICKLGTGFTDEMLQEIPRILEDYISPGKPQNVVSNIEPDEWFYPSLVMEISGAEITLSPIHTCSAEHYNGKQGLSVRFPRFTGIFRRDKQPEDATTSREILELFEMQIKKSSKQ